MTISHLSVLWRK